MLRICFDIGTNSILSPTDPWDPPGTFQNNRKYRWTTLQGRSYDRNIRLNLFSKKEEGVLEKQMVTQIQICCISMKSISPKQFFVQSFLQNTKHQKITQKRYFIKNWLHFYKELLRYFCQKMKQINWFGNRAGSLAFFCICSINIILDMSPQPPPKKKSAW